MLSGGRVDVTALLTQAALAVPKETIAKIYALCLKQWNQETYPEALMLTVNG